MAEHSRYSVTDHGAEIVGGVLKNKLGLTDQKALDDAETILLSDAYTHFFDMLEKESLTFDLSFLFEVHRFFLGPLYPWAGKLRHVDISKDDVLFAPAEYLEQSLKTFTPVLRRHIPIKQDDRKRVAQKLAFIHDELNALHPFREGNGRTIRLFLDLMATQAGYGPIEWSRSGAQAYVEACRKGMAKQHRAMEKIIKSGLVKV